MPFPVRFTGQIIGARVQLGDAIWQHGIPALLNHDVYTFHTYLLQMPNGIPARTSTVEPMFRGVWCVLQWYATHHNEDIVTLLMSASLD